jgi:hypothetical protein
MGFCRAICIACACRLGLQPLPSVHQLLPHRLAFGVAQNLLSHQRDNQFVQDVLLFVAVRVSGVMILLALLGHFRWRRRRFAAQLSQPFLQYLEAVRLDFVNIRPMPIPAAAYMTLAGATNVRLPLLIRILTSAPMGKGLIVST